MVDIARLRTMTVPLQVRYFAENGLFAKAGVNFVSQQVEERLEPFFDQTRENFVTVDLGVGFRLPERRGSVSLEVRNLFDEDFLYQDLEFDHQHHDTATVHPGPHDPGAVVADILILPP